MSYSKSISRTVILLVTLILVWTLSLSSALALEIRIKKEATVKSETVFLKDIASFHPNRYVQIARLKGIEVASAPSPGNEFVLKKHFLHYKIGSAVGDNKDIQLKVPETILVRRTAQFISAKQLKDIFEEHVITQTPWEKEKITFERIHTPREIALPEGKLQWEVYERGNPRYMGNVSIVVHLWVDGKQIRSVPISGRVSVLQEGVKASKRIKKGELIVRRDLILVQEHKIRHKKDILTTPADAIGKRALRNIQAGQLITNRMIGNPPLVEKGNDVLIRAENETIEIVTRGRVLQDGWVGDQIKVVNISSGKEISAVVKGPGVVEVKF